MYKNGKDRPLQRDTPLDIHTYRVGDDTDLELMDRLGSYEIRVPSPKPHCPQQAV